MRIVIAFDCHQLGTHIEIDPARAKEIGEKVIGAWEDYAGYSAKPFGMDAIPPRFVVVEGVNQVVTVDVSRIVTVSVMK